MFGQVAMIFHHPHQALSLEMIQISVRSLKITLKDFMAHSGNKRLPLMPKQ